MNQRIIKILYLTLILIGVNFSVKVYAANDIYSGYQTATVNTSVGDFYMRYASIDLGHPRLQIKSLATASGERMTEASPTQSLKTYVDSVGGFAGINGCYFCPADYSSCSGIEGSFYWLWYDSITGLFANSYQNQFNPGPVVAFDSNNHAYYYRYANDWPGKTQFEQDNNAMLQAAFSNGPRLVYNYQTDVNSDELDTKQRTTKSNRSGLGFKDNRLWLVVASQATVPDLVIVMQTLGMKWAVNLDGGGSSALYYDSRYRVGPGRNIPTALVFVEQATSPVAPGDSFYAYDPALRSGYYPDTGNVMSDQREEIIIGTASGLAPHVRIFDQKGNVLSQFYAYDKSLRNGVTVTSCDINKDGYEEIITGQGQGGWPLVRIYNGAGIRLKQFYVFGGKYTGGVNLSCGDTDADGNMEIIAAAMKGGGPHVLVYEASGNLEANFMAYDPSFKGGVNIAAIDLDQDGRAEIITGPQYGAPHIQIFNVDPGQVTRVGKGFYAFSATYGGGVSLDGADIDGNGTKELLVGLGAAAEPMVKALDINGRLQDQFYAYALNFRGGINLAGGDIDDDGTDEIIVIPKSMASPNVRVIDRNED